MDNNTNFSERLTHHNTENIQVKKDFFDLCVNAKERLATKSEKYDKSKIIDAKPVCMAMIIDVLEKLIENAQYEQNNNSIKNNKKKLKSNKEHKLALSYSDISSLLYNSFNDRAIIGSLYVLIQANYIKRYGIHGQTPSYTLNIPILQAALDKQANKDQLQEDDHIESSPTTKQYIHTREQIEAIGHTKKIYTEEELKSLTEEQLEARLTPKMRETFNNWCSIQKGPVSLNSKRFIALQKLEPFDTSIEILKDIREYCRITDTPSKNHPNGYFKIHGVDLWHIVQRYSKWSQTREYQGSPVLTVVGKTQGQVYSSFDEDYDYAAEFYPAKPAIK